MLVVEGLRLIPGGAVAVDPVVADPVVNARMRLLRRGVLVGSVR